MGIAAGDYLNNGCLDIVNTSSTIHRSPTLI
jgi:hypothetical protein